MTEPPPQPDTDALLKVAAEPSRDGLRLVLRPLLTDEIVKTVTHRGLEGGPFSEHCCRQIRDTGVMPPAEVMYGSVAEAGQSWPQEVFSLARCGDEFAPWQCFAAWVLLTWVTEPNDDDRIDADEETVWSVAEAATGISPEMCAHAIAYLRWQAPARNTPAPAVYHELGMACLYAAIFQADPTPGARDALDVQCKHTIDIGDRETLQAIDAGRLGWVNWPLDLTASIVESSWRELCDTWLRAENTPGMPCSAGEILDRMHDKPDPSFE